MDGVGRGGFGEVWKAEAPGGFAVALLLFAGAPAALAQVKPLEIGVLALGPRNIPVWSCGPGNPGQDTAAPQRETIPFYVLGLLNELGKLDYGANKPFALNATVAASIGSYLSPIASNIGLV